MPCQTGSQARCTASITGGDRRGLARVVAHARAHRRRPQNMQPIRRRRRRRHAPPAIGHLDRAPPPPPPSRRRVGVAEWHGTRSWIRKVGSIHGNLTTRNVRPLHAWTVCAVAIKSLSTPPVQLPLSGDRSSLNKVAKVCTRSLCSGCVAVFSWEISVSKKMCHHLKCF